MTLFRSSRPDAPTEPATTGAIRRMKRAEGRQGMPTRLEVRVVEVRRGDTGPLYGAVLARAVVSDQTRPALAVSSAYQHMRCWSTQPRVRDGRCRIVVVDLDG